MKERISRISLIIYVVLLILSGFLLSVAGDRVVWFCIMGIFAIPPIVTGPKLYYRVLGIIALMIAVAAAGFDYHAGKLHRAARDEILKQREQDSTAVDKP